MQDRETDAARAAREYRERQERIDEQTDGYKLHYCNYPLYHIRHFNVCFTREIVAAIMPAVPGGSRKQAVQGSQ